MNPNRAQCGPGREIRAPIVCQHPEAWRRPGIVYEYCGWCGAVRKPDRPGLPGFDWHVCHDCALPGWQQTPPEKP